MVVRKSFTARKICERYYTSTDPDGNLVFCHRCPIQAWCFPKQIEHTAWGDYWSEELNDYWTEWLNAEALKFERKVLEKRGIKL